MSDDDTVFETVEYTNGAPVVRWDDVAARLSISLQPAEEMGVARFASPRTGTVINVYSLLDVTPKASTSVLCEAVGGGDGELQVVKETVELFGVGRQHQVFYIGLWAFGLAMTVLDKLNRLHGEEETAFKEAERERARVAAAKVAKKEKREKKQQARRAAQRKKKKTARRRREGSDDDDDDDADDEGSDASDGLGDTRLGVGDLAGLPKEAPVRTPLHVSLADALARAQGRDPEGRVSVDALLRGDLIILLTAVQECRTLTPIYGGDDESAAGRRENDVVDDSLRAYGVNSCAALGPYITLLQSANDYYPHDTTASSSSSKSSSSRSRKKRGMAGYVRGLEKKGGKKKGKDPPSYFAGLGAREVHPDVRVGRLAVHPDDKDDVYSLAASLGGSPSLWDALDAVVQFAFKIHSPLPGYAVETWQGLVVASRYTRAAVMGVLHELQAELDRWRLSVSVGAEPASIAQGRFEVESDAANMLRGLEFLAQACRDCASYAEEVMEGHAKGRVDPVAEFVKDRRAALGSWRPDLPPSSHSVRSVVEEYSSESARVSIARFVFDLFVTRALRVPVQQVPCGGHIVLPALAAVVRSTTTEGYVAVQSFGKIRGMKESPVYGGRPFVALRFSPMGVGGSVPATWRWLTRSREFGKVAPAVGGMQMMWGPAQREATAASLSRVPQLSVAEVARFVGFVVASNEMRVFDRLHARWVLPPLALDEEGEEEGMVEDSFAADMYPGIPLGTVWPDVDEYVLDDVVPCLVAKWNSIEMGDGGVRACWAVGEVLKEKAPGVHEELSSGGVMDSGAVGALVWVGIHEAVLGTTMLTLRWGTEDAGADSLIGSVLRAGAGYWKGSMGTVVDSLGFVDDELVCVADEDGGGRVWWQNVVGLGDGVDERIVFTVPGTALGGSTRSVRWERLVRAKEPLWVLGIMGAWAATKVGRTVGRVEHVWEEVMGAGVGSPLSALSALSVAMEEEDWVAAGGDAGEDWEEGRDEGGGGCGREVMMVKGLVNLGNTCYLNAVLQTLAVLPGFPQLLANVVATPRPRLVDPGRLDRPMCC